MRFTLIMAQIINLFSVTFVVTFIYLILRTADSELNPDVIMDSTYDELYHSGLKSYTAKKWEETVFYLEHALTDFKFYRSRLGGCRITCRNASNISIAEGDPLREFRIFKGIFKQAECLKLCKLLRLGDRPRRIDGEITEKFMNLLPYSYLQFAYYKNKQYEKAITAAYTYLQANPTDEVMSNNLDYYRNIYGVEDSKIIDLEEKPHRKHFLLGAKAYDDEKYNDVIQHMEKALSYYWKAEQECRVLCEGIHNNRDFMDLYEAIADHFAATLYCKEKCDVYLNTVRGILVEDYLANHFHFLQFAYYKEMNPHSAAICAASYLLFKPGDETMSQNLRFYENQMGVNKYSIHIRSDAQNYMDRATEEAELLQLARAFSWGTNEFDDDDSESSYGIAEPINPKEVKLRRSRGDEGFWESDRIFDFKGFPPEISEPPKTAEDRFFTLGEGDDDSESSYGITEPINPNEVKLRHSRGDEGFWENDRTFDFTGYQPEISEELPNTAEDSFSKQGEDVAEEEKNGTYEDYEDYNGDVEDENLPRNYLGDYGSMFEMGEDERKNIDILKPGSQYFERYDFDDDDEIPEGVEFFPEDFDENAYRNKLAEAKDVPTGEAKDFDEDAYRDKLTEAKDVPTGEAKDFDEDAYRDKLDEAKDVPTGEATGFDEDAYRDKLAKAKDVPTSEANGFDEDAYRHKLDEAEPTDEAKDFDYDSGEDDYEDDDDYYAPERPRKDETDTLDEPHRPEDNELDPSNDSTLELDKLGRPALNSASDPAKKFDEVKEKVLKTARVPYPSLAGISLYLGPKELNGSNRVVVDGVTSDLECEILIKLLKEEAIFGDGYNGKPHPHTKHERYQGVTVLDAVEAAIDGRIPLYYPATFIFLAERGRAFVEQFFGLSSHLFFSFTHLVCRTAEPSAGGERNELSHPIHADNCILDKKGVCHKKRPAFTWRDWSSILYLNDNFVGGEFIFTDSNKTVEAEVLPKCGRLVGFSSGEENLHGVKALRSGERCALAMWYTLDSRYQETDMWEAIRAIEKEYDDRQKKGVHEEL